MTTMIGQKVTGLVTQENWLNDYLVSRGERSLHAHASQHAKSVVSNEVAPTQTKLVGQWRMKQNQLYWDWTLVS